ncbi:MAG: hypothetical protein JWR60_1773 [Polaromonas sp.]|nr:hypothetical protein [Polaromonas sp.]
MSNAFAPAGLLLAGVLTAASPAPAATAQGSVGATVIAPVSVMDTWADLPVAVSVFGGWVRLVMPPAGPPPLLSSLSTPLGEGEAAVGVAPSGDASAADVQGEFATSLSSPSPSNGGSYHVTVAFN